MIASTHPLRLIRSLKDSSGAGAGKVGGCYGRRIHDLFSNVADEAMANSVEGTLNMRLVGLWEDTFGQPYEFGKGLPEMGLYRLYRLFAVLIYQVSGCLVQGF